MKPITIAATTLATTAAAAVLIGAGARTRPATTAPLAAASSTTAALDDHTTYTIDDVHSCVLFRVEHLRASQFWGRFNDLDGTFTHSTAGGLPTFDIRVNVASVDTNTEKLDGHLKSPDFFNAADFPTVSFKSTSVERTGEGTYNVTGDFTLLGKTKTITAKVTNTGYNPDARGSNKCGYEAEFSFDRSDFGMNWGVDNGTVGDNVKIIVSIEGNAV